MQIKERKVAGTRGYQIDNFYSHPEWILNKIMAIRPQPHGYLDSKSNGVEYLDMRHKADVPDLKYYYDIVKDLIGNDVIPFSHTGAPLLQTNFMQWRNTKFNDWYNNYWYPHYDKGWTCIIYLNAESGKNGTNIYEDIDDYFSKVQVHKLEQETPWQSKQHYKVVDYLEPKFNRAYIFQAHKLLHGASVDDQTYFDSNNTFRLNQVMFFGESNG